MLTIPLAAAACSAQPPAVRPGSVRGLEPYRVDGRTYVPLRDWRGYEAVGEASWYGAAHAGRPTASGERFDPAALTAAHTVLPLDLCVQVTNLANDREVVVRVNDRGPFAERRLIDLSRAAAERLGMVRAGTAPVHVVALAPARPGGACGEP